jgi:hypothetical protein
MKQIKIRAIESATDYDILNWNDFEIEAINRYNDDDETVTVDIWNKTTEDIIKVIKSL